MEHAEQMVGRNAARSSAWQALHLNLTFKIRYLSDGLEVVGFILKPKDEDQKFPVMIYNRGGNREFGKIDVSTLEYLFYLS